jgi:membrane protein implicated in regulation of membrane protease activity
VDWVTLAFLVGGLALIASELVHLSLVPVFLGVSALVVAGLRGIGVVDSVAASLLIWSITSVALTLPLRPLARRYFKAGEVRFDRSHEDRDAVGQVVDVVEDIDDVSERGRVRFQGTTWVAQTTDGVIPKGQKVTLVIKNKLVWIVEPLNALDDVNQVPVLATEAAEVGAKK